MPPNTSNIGNDPGVSLCPFEALPQSYALVRDRIFLANGQVRERRAAVRRRSRSAPRHLPEAAGGRSLLRPYRSRASLRLRAFTLSAASGFASDAPFLRSLAIARRKRLRHFFASSTALSKLPGESRVFPKQQWSLVRQLGSERRAGRFERHDVRRTKNWFPAQNFVIRPLRSPVRETPHLLPGCLPSVARTAAVPGPGKSGRSRLLKKRHLTSERLP